ncbi:hypothetical protein [Dokdonella soli]|uniref:hypothetical protein n=1 Tax=Dokdonella soli TaxID=529810 RepID=UPI0031D65444
MLSMSLCGLAHTTSGNTAPEMSRNRVYVSAQSAPPSERIITWLAKDQSEGIRASGRFRDSDLSRDRPP